MAASARREGYEYESEDDAIIPELLSKEHFFNSPV